MGLLELIPADASQFPFIGYIVSTFPNPTAGPGGHEIGTGTLIAPRVVLTAAHIVFDPDQGGQALSMDVTFGGQRTFSQLKQVDFPMQWRQPRSTLDTSLVSPVDIAVIVLPQPIDQFITPIPFQTTTDAQLAGMMLNVGGYPAFPPAGVRGTLWGNDFNLLQGNMLPENLTQYEEFRMFYPVDTLPGVSGAPVYHFDSVSKIRTVRGVHTSFLDGVGGSALRIDEGIFQLIQHWVTTFRPS